jgi:hypothetical protein
MAAIAPRVKTITLFLRDIDLTSALCIASATPNAHASNPFIYKDLANCQCGNGATEPASEVSAEAAKQAAITKESHLFQWFTRGATGLSQGSRPSPMSYRG